MNPSDSKTTEQFEALATPLGFCRAVLQLETYPWAEKILMDLNEPGNVSVRAGNGTGKTSRIGVVAAIWNAAVHPGSLTIVSAGVHRQVAEFFHAMHVHRPRFRHWEFLTEEIRDGRSRIIGFTADRPELFEGFHAPHLMVILDECKAVDDAIYSAALRCQPERLLLLSSPGGHSGFFYESFHSRRKFFKTHVVTAFEAPHVSRQWVESIIEQYGEDHPFTRSAVFGEFMELDSGVVVPLLFVEKCLANPPAFVDDGKVAAFCDFAAGSAENVLAIRRGNKIELAGCWRESDTARAIGQFIRLFKQHNLSPQAIHADGDGLGVVFCDCLAEQGWRIQRFHGGRPANNPEAYSNMISQGWYEARRQLEKQTVIIPNDQTLIGQLTSRKGYCNSKGQLCLESKEDLAKRGLKSPDRADGFVGALMGTALHAPNTISALDVNSYGVKRAVEEAATRPHLDLGLPWWEGPDRLGPNDY